jgi:AraC family transcriptional regulator of adaptative response / DNA-3-methyladenine glycosylase II
VTERFVPSSAFTGVVTTGIYCRAGCPATPLRRNTRPFEFAAAAEAAGFRPCKRCRPDTLPGPAPSTSSSELVCRALRAIADGALDDTTDEEFAVRLGVSGRHLRRLFEQHVGASPSEVARSRRAHFARRLVDETDLTMAEIAFASGFRSVRQMNRVMRDVFRQPPSELRASRRDRERLVADGGLELRLPYRPPLAHCELLAFLAARAVPGVEHVDGDVYRRVVDVDGDPGVVELRFDPDAPVVHMRAHLPRYDTLLHVVSRARALLDLDADPDPIDAHLARDPLLRSEVRSIPGLRVPGTWSRFELGVRAILGQQVTVRAANRFAGRMVLAFGTPVAGLGPFGLSHRFPTAETLASAGVHAVAAVGVPGSRARAVVAFATAVTQGDLELGPTGDLARTLERLRAVPGIGPWTAQYIAMRAFAEPDAFPAGDAGLRRAASARTARPLTDAALTERAERWRPWRAYAALHLWTALASSPHTATPRARHCG